MAILSLFSQKTSTAKDYKNLATLCAILNSGIDTTTEYRELISKDIDFYRLTFTADSTVDTINDSHYKVAINRQNQIERISFYEGTKFVYKLLKLRTPREVKAFSIVRKEFTWPNEPDDPTLKLFGYIISVDDIHFALDYVGGSPLNFTKLMFVDKKLRVTSYCAFEKNRLTHIAEANYSANTLYRVILYIPWENHQLNENTSLSELKLYNRKYLEDVASYLTCTNVQKNTDFLKYPLWIFRDFDYRCK